MNHELGTPFDSIESAQEFLKLLVSAVVEARRDVEADVRTQADAGFERRVQALRLVLYKLEQLEKHVGSSHRILNDLRTLRRLLLEERAGKAGISEADAAEAPAHETDGGC